MRSRSHMIVDLRIPTMPGRSASGFHRSGRHAVHEARSAVRGKIRGRDKITQEKPETGEHRDKAREIASTEK